LWYDADYTGNLILGAKGVIVFGKSDEHDVGPVDGKKM
jgi:hypothetical protein